MYTAPSLQGSHAARYEILSVKYHCQSKLRRTQLLISIPLSYFYAYTAPSLQGSHVARYKILSVKNHFNLSSAVTNSVFGSTLMFQWGTGHSYSLPSHLVNFTHTPPPPIGVRMLPGIKCYAKKVIFNVSSAVTNSNRTQLLIAIPLS